MKHLRKFNETYYSNLTEFCDNHLVSLKDIGVTSRIESDKMLVKNKYNGKSFISFIHAPDNESLLLFFNNVKFSTISDDLIPFLIMLDSKFDIVDINIDYDKKIDRVNIGDLDKFNEENIFGVFINIKSD
jgi:hypothetical protein